jgi:hypothetical protein
MSFGLRFLWHPVYKADGPRLTFASPPDIHCTLPLHKQLTNEDGKKDGARRRYLLGTRLEEDLCSFFL